MSIFVQKYVNAKGKLHFARGCSYAFCCGQLLVVGAARACFLYFSTFVTLFVRHVNQLSSSGKVYVLLGPKISWLWHDFWGHFVKVGHGFELTDKALDALWEFLFGNGCFCGTPKRLHISQAL